MSWRSAQRAYWVNGLWKDAGLGLVTRSFTEKLRRDQRENALAWTRRTHLVGLRVRLGPETPERVVNLRVHCNKHACRGVLDGLRGGGECRSAAPIVVAEIERRDPLFPCHPHDNCYFCSILVRSPLGQ